MADDRYLLPQVRPPWWKRISPDRSFSLAALLVASAAAAFTGWYAYDTHRLRVEAGQAAEQARDAAERSANAATILADVAQKSLSISDRGARASERSARTAMESVATTKQLFAEGRRAEMSRIATVVRQCEAGKPILYEVHFLNSGPTRAVNVTTVTSPLALPSDRQFPSNPRYNTEGHPSTSIVLPHEHIVQHGEGDVVPTAIFERWASGATRIYIHGRIEYDDVDRKHHLTTFCDYYVPGSVTLTACPVYNAAN